MDERSFYMGKKVLVTGHTGFKGAWLCRALVNEGADVTGYALEPSEESGLFCRAGLETKIRSVIGDVRDFEHLQDVFEKSRPEIVFHLAAQPIVREGYRNPRYTYETNVMGTVNVLECARLHAGVKSVLNVTTDKVYQNREWCWGYRENERLDGFDPYSNSKSCSELITRSYYRCFFEGGDVAVSTMRAGNVIGGGDFARDRIVPDCVRAAMDKTSIRIRNPKSVRPYQHVLEAIFAYLMVARRQYENEEYAGCYNVGPNEDDCVSTRTLVELFCKYWEKSICWEECIEEGATHEAACLKLDSGKIRSKFGWKPRWNIEKAMEMTCKFWEEWISGGSIPNEMDREITEYGEYKDASFR